MIQIRKAFLSGVVVYLAWLLALVPAVAQKTTDLTQEQSDRAREQRQEALQKSAEARAQAAETRKQAARIREEAMKEAAEARAESAIAREQAAKARTEARQAQVDFKMDMKIDVSKQIADAMQIVGTASKRVVDKPFAADTQTDTVQTLADGNRIVHSTQSKYYRDRSGRTRREQNPEAMLDASGATAGEAKVFIYDPVAGINYILDPANKTAEKLVNFRMRMPALQTQAISVPSVPAISIPPTAAITIPSQPPITIPAMPAINIPATPAFTIPAIHLSEISSQAVEPMTPGFLADDGDVESAASFWSLPKVDETNDIKREDLGTKEIEGVECRGRRTVITIPAKLIGNERTIVLSEETWFSPQIDAIVRSDTADPRSGETHYSLHNLRLGDQPIELFQPGSDYKIEKGPRTRFNRRN